LQEKNKELENKQEIINDKENYIKKLEKENSELKNGKIALLNKNEKLENDLVNLKEKYENLNQTNMKHNSD